MQLSDIQPIEYARIQEEDFNIIRDTAHGYHVEVGTFHGASACAASINAKNVWTIDIYHWRPHVWYTLGIENIHFFKGTAGGFVSVMIPRGDEEEVIDTLFIDGSHEYDSVKRDIEELEPHVKKGGVIMFHDYKKESPTGVYPAVQEYLKREKPEILKEPSRTSSILKVRKC